MPDSASEMSLPTVLTALRSAIRSVRDAPFLTPERARRMARAAAVGIAVSIVALILTAHGRTDLHGTVPGGDFVAYWVAAKLAATGHAADAYLPELISGIEHRAVAMQAAGFLPYYYPPVWLVILLPFAALPYVLAWMAFCLVTFIPYILAIRQLLPRAMEVPSLWFGILGFPGLLINAGNGQNGFITGACFAGYGALLRRSPLLAGMSLGFLCLKPQFAVGVPVALLAARRVRPLAGAALSSATLVMASVALFGLAPWKAFVTALPLARHMLETGLLFPFKTAAVLGSLRMLNMPGNWAYAVQLVVALAALITLFKCTARRPGGPLEAALLALSALLVTPYATDYDLAVSGVAIAALFAASQSSGFLSWEKSVLTVSYVLPLAGPALARAAGLPVVPIVVMALFAATARRAGRQSHP